MMKKTFLLLCFSAFCIAAQAQYDKIGFGFRAGLSFSKFDGPYESAMDGTAFEKYSFNNGFHIGAILSYKFTDLVGVRTELMYSQRGTKYEYSGPSYFKIGQGVQQIMLDGTRKESLTINNAYLDIPAMIYYKIGSIELFGGLNTGLLVASTGGGTINFENSNTAFKVTLDHNYKKDDAGESSGTQQVTVNGLTYDLPARWVLIMILLKKINLSISRLILVQ